jgi:hypothetical protein
VQLFLLEKLPEYSFSSWQQLEKGSGRSAGLNAPGSLPDFVYAALEKTASAAFIEKSRMNLPAPTNSTGNPGLAAAEISARCGTDAQQVL